MPSKTTIVLIVIAGIACFYALDNIMETLLIVFGLSGAAAIKKGFAAKTEAKIYDDTRVKLDPEIEALLKVAEQYEDDAKRIADEITEPKAPAPAGVDRKRWDIS